jgi:hypothetical protein
MTSPDDLTPPTPEPLSDQRKQRMRDDLIHTAQSGSARPEHRWLVPGLAAAAALVVVAGVAVAGQRGGDGATQPTGPMAPAAGGGSTPAEGHQASRHPASAATPGTPHRAAVPPGRTHVVRRGVQVIHHPGKLPADPATTCAQEISGLGEARFDGASVTATRTYGDYTTSLYESDSAWLVCDDFAAADGGAVTLMQEHNRADAYRPSVATLGISENFLLTGESQYVAAGRAFDGVQTITYTFPDGHTQDAVLGQDGLWTMAYLPTTGPLADASTSETTLDPIQVSVDYTDGRHDSFTLDWGLNTCAQVNHGC